MAEPADGRIVKVLIYWSGRSRIPAGFLLSAMSYECNRVVTKCVGNFQPMTGTVENRHHINVLEFLNLSLKLHFTLQNDTDYFSDFFSVTSQLHPLHGNVFVL